ncbi:hypothetical protein ABPG75_008282 [Micractinium tetrahymenae]
MGKRRHARKQQSAGEGGQEQPQQSQPDYVQPADPPRCVLAVHPARGVIAVAVGPELRVYDSKTGEHRTLVTKPDQPAPAAQQPAHAARGAIPFVCGAAFDASGSRLLAGSEDKGAGLRLWDASSWELLQSIKVPKKVTNVAFTADGRHVLAADKFGDVLAAATEKPAGLKEGQQQEPEILLGHYCAIITSLSLSAGGRLLATTDRDNRVRVSIMPAEPLAGAHEIQSFCFGHTAFVTCSAFVQHGGQELLVTGGGDGTLRLWEPFGGKLLHTLELPRQQGAPTDAPVPLALVASPDGRHLVAAIDGRDELCLLQLDWAAQQLAEVGWFALPGLHLPTCLSFDASGTLWAAGGPVADDSTAAFLTCGRLEEGAGSAATAALVAAPLPAWLPQAAVDKLEAKAGNEAELLAAAAERRRLASQLLQKRKYSLAQLEGRKRRRRDKVAKAEEAAQAAAAGTAADAL